ncbi:MAG: hypothetical protein JSU85_01320 [Candidatus Zixiibacteriota bacterium]|nr:MAG: hypothetical protein JSU85_01320 [candidate division Zixibacteria bacterium]
MKKSILLFTAAWLLGLYTIIFSSVWQRDVADSTGTYKGLYNSMAIDSEDNPHIAYYDEDFNDLRYAYFNGETWSVEVVDSIGDAGLYCSIALDSQNVPHISYQQEYLGYHWSLKYATPADTGWYKIFVDCSYDTSIAEIGEYSSIAINNDGYPCISYTQNGPDEVKYAYKDSGGWHIDVVNNDVYQTYYNMLRLFNGETPVIGYHRLGDQNDNIMEIASYNSADSSWTIVQVPDSAEYISYGDMLGFDIDNQNNFYFMYINSDYDLQLARYIKSSQSWLIETYLDYPYFGGAPTIYLKIDNAGNPCLAAFQGEIYFYRKHNGQIDTSLVDELISPAWWCCLDFDSENYPRLSAYAHTPDYSYGLFYYRYWPGDPTIILPETFHNYGVVWTESYSDWNCPVENTGTAPLIISDLVTASHWTDSSFQVINVSLPMTVLPQKSDSITIRFTPFEDLVYYDTLIIYSNDSLHPEERVALQGTGTSSGDFGDLTVYARNCYAALEYHELNESPLTGAQISLYQNNQLIYGPVESGTDGSAYLENVATGVYNLTVAKETLIPGEVPVPDTLGRTFTIEVGPGTNTESIVLPESLTVQKYQSIYDLTHIIREGPLGDTVYMFSYPAELEVRELLDSWQLDLDPTVKLSIARLYLAERMTDLMFGCGYSIGGAFVHCITELINFIFFSDSWFDEIIDFLTFIWNLFTDPISALLDVVNAFARSLLLGLMDDAIQQAAAELPCITYNSNVIVCGEEIVVDAWREIKEEFSGWERIFPGFSDDSWDETEKFMHRVLMGPLFQVVYVDLLTNGQIEKAREYSENFQFDGEFSEASEYSEWFISDRTDDVETDADICRDLIMSAQLFYATATLLDIAGNLIPGAGILSSIGDALEVAAYIEVIAGIGISGHTFFTLPDQMDYAVDRIYHPNGLLQERPDTRCPWPRSKMDPSLIASLKTNLQQSSEEYDSTLSNIGNLIQSGDYESALLGLEDLMNAESDFRNDLNVSCAPVYAMANIARDSLAGFQTIYDSLKSEYAGSGMGRFKDLLYVAFSPADSGQEMIDSVLAQIDRSILQNQALVNRVGETLDTVSVLDMPAIVTVSDAGQNVYDLGQGQTATIRLSLKNVGALPAENVSLVMSTNDALSINEADSMYIGSLQPGEETETYTWTVELANNDYSRGIWTANINSSNARTFPYSGSLVTPLVITPPTGGRLTRDNVYCYPNPFNPDIVETTLRYSLERAAEVTVRIYDAGGNLVITLMDDVRQPAGEELSVVWEGRNGKGDVVSNGVYFFIIETSENERAVGKIAVLR